MGFGETVLSVLDLTVLFTDLMLQILKYEQRCHKNLFFPFLQKFIMLDIISSAKKNKRITYPNYSEYFLEPDSEIYLLFYYPSLRDFELVLIH